MFQYTISVNKKQFLKRIGQHNFWGFRKIWSTYLGSLKNLVNIFRGLRKWPDMITPVIKVNEFPLGQFHVQFRIQCLLFTGLFVAFFGKFRTYSAYLHARGCWSCQKGFLGRFPRFPGKFYNLAPVDPRQQRKCRN